MRESRSITGMLVRFCRTLLQSISSLPIRPIASVALKVNLQPREMSPSFSISLVRTPPRWLYSAHLLDGGLNSSARPSADCRTVVFLSGVGAMSTHRLLGHGDGI